MAQMLPHHKMKVHFQFRRRGALPRSCSCARRSRPSPRTKKFSWKSSAAATTPGFAIGMAIERLGWDGRGYAIFRDWSMQSKEYNEEGLRKQWRTRECQVRICERLGVKFPGPTRPNASADARR